LVRQESGKFEVTLFTVSSVVKLTAFAYLPTVMAKFSNISQKSLLKIFITQILRATGFFLQKYGKLLVDLIKI
jgi:hypothetical protein